MAVAAWDIESTRSPSRPVLRLACGDELPVRTRRVSARTYRRRRVLAALAAVLAVAAVVVMTAALLAPARPATPASDRGGATTVVVVGPDDTLWDLALSRKPATYDPQAWVAEVIATNDVDPRRLPVGSVLRFPVPTP